MAISKEILKKLENMAIMTNKIRFYILVSLFNSDVLKIGHSLTFGQLREITNCERNDLAYHIKILKNAKLLEKGKENSRFYSITDEGKELLKEAGFTKTKIKEMSKEITS